MVEFEKVFNNAMELSCLGLYEKVQEKSDQGKYKYSPLLKKALDKFSLLNMAYSLFDEKGDPILPSNEAALIKIFNFPIRDLIHTLPGKYQKICKTMEWYAEESYITIGSDNCYYCMPDLLDKLNNDIVYKKAKRSNNKELELESQKFIKLLFARNQEEYCEIRNFLEQKDHVFITNGMFLENDNIRTFKKKYTDIFDAAYEKLNYNSVHLKTCDHCGLVLREMSDGRLYCVSERCSKKSKGFAKYNKTPIKADEIWILKLNVSRYIYYPGILEQNIKKVLEKANISPTLWPDKDTWDFRFEFAGQAWVIDAKDVKNPMAIQEDIKMKQDSSIQGNKDILHYDNVLYVVPSDRSKRYLEIVREVIKDNMKMKCITFADFKRMINERLELHEK